MGKQKKTRRFAQVKRMMTPKNPALKKNIDKLEKKRKAEAQKKEGRNVEQYPAALFFKHNEALGPPYRVLVDTNFINFSIKNKIEIVRGMMDCLLAKCIPCILESVIAELEKLGPKYVAFSPLAVNEFARTVCLTYESVVADITLP